MEKINFNRFWKDWETMKKYDPKFCEQYRKEKITMDKLKHISHLARIKRYFLSKQDVCSKTAMNLDI